MLLAVTLFYFKLETVRFKVKEMKNNKQVRPDEGKRLSDTHKVEDVADNYQSQF